jgi:hypothetical protein
MTEFRVAVFGQPPLFYQWRQNGTNLADGPGITGSTNRVFQFTNVVPANAGQYSVVVGNALGVVVSDDAQLTVQIPPPVLQSLAIADGAFSFAWNSVPGLRYQIQFSPDLRPAVWTDLGPVITAVSSVTTASEANVNSQRFYRVVWVP